ncbi:MAG: radical SAM protein, partial [Clostridiales bacterium]|nr:radical SAM protein [Clostridiales bacterium]
LEEQGEHIPPFLIASITSSCNLHCAGCYAWENHICSDGKAYAQLSADEWDAIFREARDLGIGFILLAGGEPMMRRDILEKAAQIPEILFPVFTNGTLLNDSYIQLFDKSRNLVPVFSIEGDEKKTDERRGAGIYKSLIRAMDKIKDNHLIFGASVTVTTSNLNEVVSDSFISVLQERGCKVVIYVEFVPITDDSAELAPQDAEREFLKSKLMASSWSYGSSILRCCSSLSQAMRKTPADVLPQEEGSSISILTAARNHVHSLLIPTSMFEIRLLEKHCNSKLFTALQDGDVLMEDHAGGCVLFERKDQVEQLLNNE